MQRLAVMTARLLQTNPGQAAHPQHRIEAHMLVMLGQLVPIHGLEALLGALETICCRLLKNLHYLIGHRLSVETPGLVARGEVLHQHQAGISFLGIVLHALYMGHTQHALGVEIDGIDDVNRGQRPAQALLDAFQATLVIGDQGFGDSRQCQGPRAVGEPGNNPRA